MTLEDMISDIKIDLGSDVVSIAITDRTITSKISEALRKISSYAPKESIGSFPMSGNSVTLPEGTICVTEVLNQGIIPQTQAPTDDQNLFYATKYMFSGRGGTSDPFTLLLQKNQLNTLSGFVTLKDWHYDPRSRSLLISGSLSSSNVVVKYFTHYEDISEVEDARVLQRVKEYALASCKIIEGMIRRKMQNAPGSIQLDGDSLVQEGKSERDDLEEKLPRIFSYLRMGVRV